MESRCFQAQTQYRLERLSQQIDYLDFETPFQSACAHPILFLQIKAYRPLEPFLFQVAKGRLEFVPASTYQIHYVQQSLTIHLYKQREKGDLMLGLLQDRIESINLLPLKTFLSTLSSSQLFLLQHCLHWFFTLFTRFKV